jgi:hypothetical protein
MNKDRQIQLLYPPFFFLAALAVAVYLDPIKGIGAYLPITKDAPIGLEKLVGIVAAGGILIIVTGFFIGTVSICLLRLVFRVFGHSQYEAVLPHGCLARIWPKLRTTQQRDKSLTLFATATFDHELLPKSIHEWLLRRWSSFNICVRSCFALALASLLVWGCSIHPGRVWYVSVLVVVVFFAIQATLAWRETMSMIDFQSHRELPPPKGAATTAGDSDSPEQKGHDTEDDDDA